MGRVGSEMDAELLAAAASGSEQAFASLYRRHYPRVFRFALHMCGSHALAEEVVQEVFLAMVGQLQQFDSARGAIGPYLLGIARNQSLRLMKRERPFAELHENSASVAADEGDLEQQRLRRAIAALPAEYREVVLLVELEEMEYQEAAAVIGCPVGTVRSRLHRAKAILMERLVPAALRSVK